MRRRLPPLLSPSPLLPQPLNQLPRPSPSLLRPSPSPRRNPSLLRPSSSLLRLLLRRRSPRLPTLANTSLPRPMRRPTIACSRRWFGGWSPSTTSTSTASLAPVPVDRITRDDVLDYIDRAAVTAAGSGCGRRRRSCARRRGSRRRTRGTCARRRPAPAVAAGERDSAVRLSKIRKLTGNHMVMSKGVSPHAFSVVEVDFANVDVARNQVKNEWKATEGFGLTYLPFITRAVVEALDEFPHLNASVSDEDLIVHNFVDIGIAVDLDYQGLLVPVVRAAETKRLRAIAREINDLASRARSRKLSPDEISGGTFTISNNGSAGSVLTMPIINQPQVAILSTDAITRKPVVVSTADGGEGIAIHPVGNVAMAWDHRAFDGAYAAGFLVKIKQTLETRDWSAEL